MGRGYYLLKGREVVPVDDLRTWALALEQSYTDGTHWVGDTTVGPWVVTTIFLGLDFQIGLYARPGAPLVFETMIRTNETFPMKDSFSDRVIERPDWADYQDRCSTYAQAEAMHKAACDQAFAWVDQMTDALPQIVEMPQK